MPLPPTSARATELLAQARILAVIMWALLIFDSTSATAVGRLSGLVVGTDFVQFYTTASAAREGRLSDVAVMSGLHAQQIRVVPESHASHFPPVYPPQVALVLRPLAYLSYRQAYLAWALVTVLLYAGAVRLLLRATPRLSAWPAHVGWIAAAFPALWFVVLHGQLSVLALLSLAAACVALRHRRTWLAGVALGLLAYKPSLFVPAVALCALAGEWRMVAGAGLAGLGQFALAVLIVDLELVRGYILTMIELLQKPDAVATNLPLMHSLRTFWLRLVPGSAAMGCYVASAAVVAIAAARGWRTTEDPLHRIGLLAIAMVLISPHLFVYDLVVIVPTLLAVADALVGSPRTLTRLRPLTYLTFFAPVWSIPVAMLRFQASTLLLSAWFLALLPALRTGVAESSQLPPP